MIKIIEGILWFEDSQKNKIQQLMNDQSSCAGSAYQVYIKNDRIKFVNKIKQIHDINLIAKSLINIAIKLSKPIAFESLKFQPKKTFSKKFNRMKSNFVYRKIITAIKSRALRFGIETIEVNPAFTSILDNLKYSKMYLLNRHETAALVIARRGIGIKERQTFTIFPVLKTGKTVKIANKREEKLNLVGRGFSHTLSSKACSWLLEEPFLKPKSVTFTGSRLIPDSKPGISPSGDGIPPDESVLITSQNCPDFNLVAG
jgi:IS605 OrfB family transposase